MDIFNGVRCGVDTFDCVMPTRAARHGNALVMAHHWDDDCHNKREQTVEPSSLNISEVVRDDVELQAHAPTLAMADPSVLAEVEHVDSAISSIRAQLHRYEQVSENFVASQ